MATRETEGCSGNKFQQTLMDSFLAVAEAAQVGYVAEGSAFKQGLLAVNIWEHMKYRSCAAIFRVPEARLAQRWPG